MPSKLPTWKEAASCIPTARLNMIPTCICKSIQMQIVISHDFSFSSLNTFPGLQLDPGKHNGLHCLNFSEGLGCCRPWKTKLHLNKRINLLDTGNTMPADWHCGVAALPHFWGQATVLAFKFHFKKHLSTLPHSYQKFPVMPFTSVLLGPCSRNILHYLLSATSASNPSVLLPL